MVGDAARFAIQNLKNRLLNIEGCNFKNNCPYRG